MTTPSVTGSALSFVGTTANAATVSSTITVPADATYVLAGVTGYRSPANPFSSGLMTFTQGGVDTTMTNFSAGGDGNTADFMCGLFGLPLPDTGTNKTLKCDWEGTGTLSDPSVLFSIIFLKDVDTASPSRSSGGVQASGVPYTTGSLAAVSGDLAVAYAGGFVSANGSIDSWSNLTLLSQLTAATNADGAWATGTPSGTSTFAALTATNFADGGICVVVLKPSGPTGPFDPTYQDWPLRSGNPKIMRPRR